MAYIDMVHSHVERLLREQFDLGEVTRDVDGDYPFRHGCAACWVSVRPMGPHVVVTVFAHAARGVRPSAGLLRSINDAHREQPWVRVYLIDDIVVADASVLATVVDGESLWTLCREVGRVADELGREVATAHGGSTVFPEEIDGTDLAAEDRPVE